MSDQVVAPSTVEVAPQTSEAREASLPAVTQGTVDARDPRDDDAAILADLAAMPEEGEEAAAPKPAAKAPTKPKEDPAKEAGADAATDEAKVAPPVDDIQKQIDERIRRHTEEVSVKTAERERIRQEERESIRQEERESIRQEVRAEQRAAARANPLKHVEDIGFDPHGLMEVLADPASAQAKAKTLAERDEVQSLKSRLDAFERHQKEQAQRAQQEAQAAHIQQVRKSFIEAASVADKRPVLTRLLSSPVADSVILAANMRGLSVQQATGKLPSHDELADWLESTYAPALGAATSTAAAPPAKNGSGSVARSPTQGQASERRTASKPTREMSEQELDRLILEDLAAQRD